MVTKNNVTATFGNQLGKVYRLMQDGQARTLQEISVATGASEASVSARLRDLRKAQFGGFTVSRYRTFVYMNGRYRGVFKYTVTVAATKKSRRSF
jgi:DNA-binding transcriptional regulator GbsR (MarR family)